MRFSRIAVFKLPYTYVLVDTPSSDLQEWRVEWELGISFLTRITWKQTIKSKWNSIAESISTTLQEQDNSRGIAVYKVSRVVWPKSPSFSQGTDYRATVGGYAQFPWMISSFPALEPLYCGAYEFDRSGQRDHCLCLPNLGFNEIWISSSPSWAFGLCCM